MRSTSLESRMMAFDFRLNTADCKINCLLLQFYLYPSRYIAEYNKISILIISQLRNLSELCLLQQFILRFRGFGLRLIGPRLSLEFVQLYHGVTY
jgi:hypothetical protein